MPDLLLFEWEKDRDGYEIVEFDPRGVEWNRAKHPDWKVPIPKGASIEKAKLIERWDMFLCPAMDDDWRPFKVIEPVGNGNVRIEPLSNDNAPFREFADLGTGEDRIVAFADKYGPLNRQPRLERLDVWQTEIRRMHTAVTLLEKATTGKSLDEWVASFNRRRPGWMEKKGRVPMSIELRTTHDPLRPFLHVVPDDLISAMWLQLAQHVSASTQLKRCTWCPAWFLFGSGTNHRRSAHYCSPRCQKAAHRAGQRKVS